MNRIEQKQFSKAVELVLNTHEDHGGDREELGDAMLEAAPSPDIKETILENL
tara:strand:- start:9 stop:164 length:156 start_codon:yes stop_codon:yes gene_type:complete